MNKTGFIIDNLLASQINLDVLQHSEGFVFTKELTKTPFNIKMVVMDISEIWGFDDGELIATSVDTALFMKNAVCNSKKTFYIYDYDEIKYRRDKDHVLRLMHDENIHMCVRSKFIQNQLKKQFNRTSTIWENIHERFCTKE